MTQRTKDHYIKAIIIIMIIIIITTEPLPQSHLMLGRSRSVCLLASLRKWVMISAGSLMRGRTGLPGGMVLSVSASSLVGVASSSGGGGKVTPRSDCHTHLLGQGIIS